MGSSSPWYWLVLLGVIVVVAIIVGVVMLIVNWLSPNRRSAAASLVPRLSLHRVGIPTQTIQVLFVSTADQS